MAEQIITRQLKEQKHPMPVEYAIWTLAPAMLTLSPGLLRRLPVQQWLEWTKGLALENVGEEIVSGVKARLASVGEELSDTGASTSEWIRNTAPILQSAASNATCLLAGIGYLDAQTAMPTTLFGERWAGVKVSQEPKLSQEQPGSITMPPESQQTAKDARAERSAKRAQDWRISGKGRRTAAGKTPNLGRFLQDFMESKAADGRNSPGTMEQEIARATKGYREGR